MKAADGEQWTFISRDSTDVRLVKEMLFRVNLSLNMMAIPPPRPCFLLSGIILKLGGTSSSSIGPWESVSQVSVMKIRSQFS